MTLTSAPRHELDVTVPEGVVPGDEFEVQLGGIEEADVQSNVSSELEPV
jgi:hypothetical protein